VKIALVSPYDFVYPGGVANHISCLEHQLTLMGHEVKVIAPASGPVSTFGDRFIRIGKPLPIPNSGSIVRISISVRLASTIKAVFDRERFDILHLHEPFMPMLCSAMLRFSNTTNIGTFHAFQRGLRYLSHPLSGYNIGRPISTIMLKRRARKLNGKIAVSKPAMIFASKYVPGDYNIIPNGIDLSHFSLDASPIDEFSDGKLNILFVGRMEKRKGLNYLIEAYRQVKQEIPNSRLIIAGPGNRLRRRHEKLVNRNGLKDVVFTGYVPYDELPRYYKTADIFCSPATGRESFGISLLEAMAMGKPVVASNIDGYASLITNDVEGLLIPPKDIIALAQALISLMRDESLRQQIGSRARLTAEKYDWKLVAQRVLGYYVSTLSKTPRRE
jgi:phosphatidylinositol alpha-mannosyltransferase